MTHFEYVTVAYSIVIALCIARGLDAIPSAIRASRRYWVHLIWVFIKLINVVVLWWVVWEFRDAKWTYIDFILLLLSPVFIYLQIIFLVTTEPHVIKDWRTHYYGQCRHFFSLNAFLNVLLIAGNMSAPDGPNNFVAIAQVGLILGSIAAAVSSNERIHAAFVVYTAFVNVVGFSLAIGAL